MLPLGWDGVRLTGQWLMRPIEGALEDRLGRLEEDVGRILAGLSAGQSLTKLAELYVAQATIEAGVRHELKALDIRHRIFPGPAHDQVAWTMLLATYRHGAERKRLSVTALGSYCHTPATTALRHLTSLEEAGQRASEADVTDCRRRWISLSGRARGLMVRYFTALHG